MSSFIKKVEQKLGDHENVSSDPDVAPHKGEGIGQGDDPNKSWVHEKIRAGQGADSKMVEQSDHKLAQKSSIEAGNTTSPDTKSSAEAAGVGIAK